MRGRTPKSSRTARGTTKLRRSFRQAFGLGDSESNSESAIGSESNVSLVNDTHDENIVHQTSHQGSTNADGEQNQPTQIGVDNASKLAQFKSALFNDPSTPDCVTQLWKSLFNPPATRGYNWKDHRGDFAPFESEFSMGWIRLFLSVPWSKAQWGLLRVFVMWLSQKSIQPPLLQVREYKSMKSLTGCLPGVGLSIRKKDTIWKKRKEGQATRARVLTETRLTQSQQSTGNPSEALTASRVDLGTSLKAIESTEVSFYVHPLQTQLMLSLLIPNAQVRIKNPLPRARRGAVNGIWETPGMVYRHMLKGGYVIVRDKPTLLTLRPGCEIWNNVHRQIAFVTKLQWEQPHHYEAARLKGLPAKEIGGWNNIHDRRPYVTITMALFEARACDLGVLAAGQTYTFVKKKVAVSFGRKEDRVCTAQLPIAGRVWFDDWKAVITGGLSRSKVTHMRHKLGQREDVIDPEHPPPRLIKIWAQKRQAKQALQHTHACEPNFDVHCSVGWDGFSASHFGSLHRSSVGYYTHVLNTCDRFPTLPFCIADKSVPVRCVVKKLWHELVHLSHEQPMLGVRQSPGSSEFDVELFNVRLLLSAVCLDKEMMDIFHLAASSSAASRCDGPMYRGFQDGLLCEDVCSLDGRYLRSMSHTLSARQEVLPAQDSTAAYDRVCTHEGWARDPWAEEMLPKDLPLDSYLLGQTDPLHTWDGILERLMEWCTGVGESSFPDFWPRCESYLSSVQSLNGMETPHDPFGKSGSERTNMKLRRRQAYYLWFCMHAIIPGNPAVFCLRKGLNLLNHTYACRSEENVRKVQDLTRDFLRDLDKFSTEAEVDFNFPKTRSLINIAFINLPLFRNALLWESARFESDHTYYKRTYRNHCNWTTEAEKFLVDFNERVRGLALLDAGLRLGPQLQYQLSDRARLHQTPQDNLLQGLTNQAAEGWRMGQARRMHFDLLAGRPIELEKFAEDYAGMLSESGTKTEEIKSIRIASRIQLCTMESNFEGGSGKGLWFLCLDSDDRLFVIQESTTIECTNSERREIWMHGDIYLVSTPEDDPSMLQRRNDVKADMAVPFPPDEDLDTFQDQD